MRVHFKKNIWLVLPVALSILLTGCGREDALEAGLQVQDTESILQDGPQKESGAETAEASESEIKPKSEEEAGSGFLRQGIRQLSGGDADRGERYRGGFGRIRPDDGQYLGNLLRAMYFRDAGSGCAGSGVCGPGLSCGGYYQRCDRAGR